MEQKQQKPQKQPSLAVDIGSSIALAIKFRDKKTIDFYKKFRADDIDKYMSNEIFRYLQLHNRELLDKLLENAQAVGIKPPVGNAVKHAVSLRAPADMVHKLIIEYADKTDSKVIHDEIMRLSDLIESSKSEFEKKNYAERLAALMGYDLMIAQRATSQPALPQTQETAQQAYNKLAAAIAHKDVSAAEKILTIPGLSLNINQPDSANITLLEYAIMGGDLDMVKLLLKHNANAKIPGLLHHIIRNAKPAMVEVLLQHGADQTTRIADVLIPFKTEGVTPLEIVEHEIELVWPPNAPRKQQLEQVKQILEKFVPKKR